MHEKSTPEAVPQQGVPKNFDLLVQALLRLTCHSASRVPLGTQVLLDWETWKQTKGNSQAGVSFPWRTCSLWTTWSLRSRAGEGTCHLTGNGRKRN